MQRDALVLNEHERVLSVLVRAFKVPAMSLSHHAQPGARPAHMTLRRFNVRRKPKFFLFG
jgi:hypothetical protein